MDHNDLSKQLDSFSISSDQEKITRALDKTHIASTPIFGAPSPSQQPSVYSGLMPNSHADTTSDWDPAAAAAAAATASSHVPPAEQDGWGEGPPSYTSISQGTYFGFNSILEAPNAMLARPPQANASTNTTAFSRFRNAPVTFASAAAEAAKNSGGDIPEINQ